MARKLPLIALIGRTNVGKSTLFNQIAGRKISVVEDTHGVTRDRNYAFIRRHGMPFTLVDTGGLLGEENQALAEAVREQTQLAILDADVIIALFDGVAGPHPHDSEVVNILRRTDKPVIWVVNKTEKEETELRVAEFYSLGVDEIFSISAAHNKGIKELIKKFYSLPIWPEKAPKEEKSEEDPIHVAILGKPNVGKSTLTNRILGEERVITSPIAGTTRDRIDVTLKRDGRQFIVSDTAGLRKKAKVKSESIERYSNLRSLKELAECDVAILMIDASAGPPTEQDARIAGLIHERGRALCIAVNKWDAIEKDHKTAKEFKDKVHEVFKFARYAPVLFISALTGKRCPSIFSQILAVYEQAHKRVSTSELNRVLERAFTKNPPPVYRGEPIKLYFATQVSVAPPTFVLFLNHPKKLNFSYERYIRNALRKEFGFEGNDIKLIFRKRTSKAHREDQVANG
ncbi:MAG: ribosome biogenesis GTPase Der [Bdellovibrionales bacterium]|nr:ribosome biogenesis GTPase Der [Bdellovibrionales bacterium]